MKVTILGSSGQIGAYLTEYLRDKGHQVIEFDKNFDERHDMTVIPNIKLHGAIHQSDFVFFLAFDVGGSHYLKKYQHTFGFLDNNARMMVNAFEYIQNYKKPFVFASSQMSNMSYSPYGVMENYSDFTSNDELHITTGDSTDILGIARTIQSLFKEIDREVTIAPSESKDEVQKDARNVPDPYIKKWWQPKTSVTEGITKVFNEMKKNYD
jgi:nucleoside-diphosphate-sugar epimerase